MGVSLANRLAALEAKVEEQQKQLDAMSGLGKLIPNIVEHIVLFRGAMWAIMSQATKDEPSQDPAANPWITHKLTYAKKVNPLVAEMNALTGVKTPPPPEGASSSIIIATEAATSRLPPQGMQRRTP